MSVAFNLGNVSRVSAGRLFSFPLMLFRTEKSSGLRLLRALAYLNSGSMISAARPVVNKLKHTGRVRNCRKLWRKLYIIEQYSILGGVARLY